MLWQVLFQLTLAALVLFVLAWFVTGGIACAAWASMLKERFRAGLFSFNFTPEYRRRQKRFFTIIIGQACSFPIGIALILLFNWLATKI